jgi:hypothetical protein
MIGIAIDIHMGLIFEPSDVYSIYREHRQPESCDITSIWSEERVPDYETVITDAWGLSGTSSASILRKGLPAPTSIRWVK